MAQEYSFTPRTLNDLVRRDKALKLSEKLSYVADDISLDGINLLTICYLKVNGTVTDDLAVLVGIDKGTERFPDLEKAMAPYSIIYRKMGQATNLLT